MKDCRKSLAQNRRASTKEVKTLFDKLKPRKSVFLSDRKLCHAMDFAIFVEYPWIYVNIIMVIRAHAVGMAIVLVQWLGPA